MEVTKTLASNESQLKQLREENQQFKSQIESLTSMITKLLSAINPITTNTTNQQPTNITTLPSNHQPNTNKSPSPNHSSTPATIPLGKMPAKISAPNLKEKIETKKQTNSNPPAVATTPATTPTQRTQHGNKMSTINFNTSASLICGYIPSTKQANNFVKLVNSKHNVQVWFPTNKPNVIQFQFDSESEMMAGISLMNNHQGNQWASPCNNDEFNTSAKGFGEATTINEATEKISKIVIAIKAKQLSSTRLNFSMKDEKFKIIVTNSEMGIDTIQTHSFGAVRKATGIQRNTAKYNLTCVITFSNQYTKELAQQTINAIFNSVGIALRETDLTYNENISKYGKRETYHSFRYHCKDNDEVDSLLKGIEIVTPTNGTKKASKRFKRYSDTNKPRSTATPYPPINNFSNQPQPQQPTQDNNQQVTDLTTKVNQQEKDIQIIKEDNKDIKTSMNRLEIMMNAIADKLGIGTTAGASTSTSTSTSNGSMDMND